MFTVGLGPKLTYFSSYRTAEVGAYVFVFIYSLLFLKFYIKSLTLFVVLDLYVSFID